ncbi:MAG: hypothetical protein AAF127_11285 [Pseudomonadota bacterium]
MDASFLMPALFGAAIAAIGVGLQWLLAKESIAQAAHFALGMILALYIGARLASDSLTAVLVESGFAAAMLLASLLCLRHWPRGVGILIIGHGIYDQIFAHDAGMPVWYPPFCLGVDVVLGLGIVALVRPK